MRSRSPPPSLAAGAPLTVLAPAELRRALLGSIAWTQPLQLHRKRTATTFSSSPRGLSDMVAGTMRAIPPREGEWEWYLS